MRANAFARNNLLPEQVCRMRQYRNQLRRIADSNQQGTAPQARGLQLLTSILLIMVIRQPHKRGACSTPRARQYEKIGPDSRFEPKPPSICPDAMNFFCRNQKKGLPASPR